MEEAKQKKSIDAGHSRCPIELTWRGAAKPDGHRLLWPHQRPPRHRFELRPRRPL